MIPIIPKPFKIEEEEKDWELPQKTIIAYTEETQKEADKLKEFFEKYNRKVETYPFSHENAKNAHICLSVGDLPDKEVQVKTEAYWLRIYKDEGNAGITIIGTDNKGVFYAIQTLKQLILLKQMIKEGKEREDQIILPCITITDYPRFTWRSFMLDSGRHFFPIDEIKEILDIMALLKLNKFHWHLTEDQGWRIEIKQYPKLIEIGSKRKGTQRKRGRKKQHDGIPYEGHYTQDEIKQIISYAQEKHIEVIPEIEMPGHSMAALASYPELGCTGGPYEVGTRWGIYKDVYCAGKESTFEFLENVLKEVMDIFPSPYIHIGGDEVPKDRWKNCPACQKRIKEENLKDENALQVYFTNRISRFLKEHNKILIGWNEILDEGLVKEAICQFWKGGFEEIKEELSKGRRFIISKNEYTYLNYSYHGLPLSKSYNFEPIPEGTDEKYAPQILGLEAPAWTEWIPDRQTLHKQIFPRLIAYAETGWTAKERKDYEDFKERLTAFLTWFKEIGIGFTPVKEADKIPLERKIKNWLKRFKKR